MPLESVRLHLAIASHDSDLLDRFYSFVQSLPVPHRLSTVEGFDAPFRAMSPSYLAAGKYDIVFLDMRSTSSPRESGLCKLLERPIGKTRFILLSHFGQKFPDLDESPLVLKHFSRGEALDGADFREGLLLFQPVLC